MVTHKQLFFYAGGPLTHTNYKSDIFVVFELVSFELVRLVFFHSYMVLILVKLDDLAEVGLKLVAILG